MYFILVRFISVDVIPTLIALNKPMGMSAIPDVNGVYPNSRCNMMGSSVNKLNCVPQKIARQIVEYLKLRLLKSFNLIAGFICVGLSHEAADHMESNTRQTIQVMKSTIMVCDENQSLVFP